MAERSEALVLQMSADIRRMEKALAKIAGDANTQLGRTEKRFDKLNDHIKRSGDQMARDLRGAFATIGVSMAIREVAQYADAWTTASNKLSSAGIAQEKLASTMQDLVALSKDTRQNFSDTVALYARLTIAGQKLGLVQEQIRRITELTSKAFVAGGASAQEQAAGIIQLGQALSSGFLQGDELRSLRENAPLLAQAIADEFGVTIGELKKLGAEGQLTSDRVARAILNANGITEAFSRTVTTLGQAMENLRTEFTRYIAESKTAQAVIAALGGFIQFVTDNLDLLADAAIVAAVAIGGTLAGQALARFVLAIRTARFEAKKAGTEFLVLRTAMSFLGGPMGAAVVGIAAALGAMALNATDTSVSVDDLNDGMAKFQELSQKGISLTDDLRAAQDRLNKAIETQGAVAQNTARLQVQGIEQQIAANDKLIERQRIQLKNDLDALKRQDAPRSAIQAALDGPNGQMTIGDKRSRLFGPDGLQTIIGGRGQGETRDAYLKRARDYLNGIRGRVMDQVEQEFSQWIADIEQFDADLLRIQNQVADIERALNISPDRRAATQQLGVDISGIRGEATDAPGATGSGGVRGYQNSLEALRETISSVGEAADADAAIFNRAAMSLDVLLDLRDRWERYGAFNPETGARIAPPGFTGTMDPGDPAPENAITIDEWNTVMAQSAQDDFARMAQITADLDANAARRSREILQALLQYMESSGVRAAFDQLPSLQQLLLGDDLEIFRSEAAKRVKAAAAELATGYAKLQADRDAAVQKASAAMSDALGFDQAGFDAMSASARRSLDGAADVYLQAISNAWDEFNAGVQELTAKSFSIDLSTPELDQRSFADFMPSVDNINAANDAAAIAAGLFPSEAQEEFRQLMRDSVKSALRDGIRTGDWDEAFRSILADAVTSGLDAALNRVGDWLADFLFAPDGFLGSLIAGAGNWAGQAMFGGRPTGGGVLAGGAYRVNDRADNGEFLFMGSNAGQVLRASDINGMMAGGRGGGNSVVLNLNVAGSIDAVTWPRVESALTNTKHQIMSSMPTAVRGTIAYDRKHKRR